MITNDNCIENTNAGIHSGMPMVKCFLWVFQRKICYLWGVGIFQFHFIFSGICHFFEQIIPWLIDQNCVNTKRQFINLPLLLNPTHLQGFCVLSSKSLWTRSPLKKPEKVSPSFGRGGNREKFFSNDCEFFFCLVNVT